MRWNHLWLTVCLLAVGCGGEVEQGPNGGGDQTAQGNPTGTGSDAAASNGSAAGSAGKPRLGNCAPGKPQAQAATCLWLAREICYPTKEAACNCICPTDVVEVFCLSDFPEEGIPTEVYCT